MRPSTRRLAAVRKAAGQSYPLYMAGQAVAVPRREPIVDVSPDDTSMLLGRFARATTAHVDRAVKASRAAQPGWARRPWQDRVRILRRAAELIRERKFEWGPFTVPPHS
jgi:1-pyrroline-5-carboxylate dehydrogenase